MENSRLICNRIDEAELIEGANELHAKRQAEKKEAEMNYRGLTQTAIELHRAAAELHRIAADTSNGVQTEIAAWAQQPSHDATKLACELTNKMIETGENNMNGEYEVNVAAMEADERSQGPGEQDEIITAHYEAASHHECTAECLEMTAPWN